MYPRSLLWTLKQAKACFTSAASRGVCYPVFPSLARKRKQAFVSLASLGNKRSPTPPGGDAASDERIVEEPCPQRLQELIRLIRVDENAGIPDYFRQR